MSIEFYCEECGKFLRTTDDKAGRRGTCPQCRAPIIVPPASIPPAEEDIFFEAVSEEHSWYVGSESDDDRREPDDDRFASRRRSQTCPMCGADNVPSAARCSHCGEELNPGFDRRRQSEEGNLLIFSQILNQTIRRFESNIGLCLGGVLLTLMTMVAGIVAFYMLLVLVGIGMFGMLRNAVNAGGTFLVLIFLGGLAIYCFNSWLVLGLNQFLLKIARSRNTNIADLFSVSLPMVGNMILTTFVFSILVSVVAFGTMIFIGIGFAISPLIAVVVGCIGFILYLMLILAQWCYPYVIVDRHPSGLDALTTTFRLMKGNYLTMFLVFLCLTVLNIMGSFLCGVGLLFTIPFGALMLAVAYDQLTYIESI